MILSDYVRDRMPAFVIEMISIAVTVIFLVAFKVDKQAIAVVAVIFTVTAVLVELWEYNRKSDFYNRLNTALTELDKKYLLPELLEEPSFYEGRFICDILRECSKSMTENVAVYRKSSEEFREYIEMWVHEVKLPVASIRLICHNNPDIDRKMIGQIKRIDDYIENVLYYARSENAGKDYIIKEVSLQKAFGSVAVKNREALQLLDAKIESSNLKLSVLTDGKWLEYMIAQLMANSIKYHTDSRKLVINAYARNVDDAVVFYFRDNGCGVVAGDIPRVFDKSFTGQNGRVHQNSTGMGLYIVKKMCDRLGHRIILDSKYGEYTEVQIAFAGNNHY